MSDTKEPRDHPIFGRVPVICTRYNEDTIGTTRLSGDGIVAVDIPVITYEEVSEPQPIPTEEEWKVFHKTTESLLQKVFNRVTADFESSPTDTVYEVKPFTCDTKEDKESGTVVVAVSAKFGFLRKE